MPYVIKQDDISVLSLSVRSQNCLKRANINTIQDLLDYSENEFINIRNMGAKSLSEIQGVIQSLMSGVGEYILVENNSAIHEENNLMQAFVDSDGSVTIILDENNSVIQDISIEALNLSVRAKNSLTNNGYLYASQLIGITHDTLLNMRSMGAKTADEVLAYSEKISATYRNFENPDNDDNSDSLINELFNTYGGAKNVWFRELLIVKVEFPEASGETLIYRLYDRVCVREAIKVAILKFVEDNDNEISLKMLEEYLPQHLNNTTIVTEVLLELESNSSLELGEVKIHRQYPSITKFAAKIENDRVREVIQGRISGKTLSEIGDEYGITRERVRQLMEKGLQNRPRLREDKYVYIFDNYDFSLEDFKLAFDEVDETFYYLEMICRSQRNHRKPLDEILTDVTIAPEFRKKAERAIYKHYISTDGIRVKMTRPTLIKHYVKTYCKTLTKYDDFVAQYHQWIDSLELTGDSIVTIESRVYENILNACDYVLWNQWRSFRYYNIAGQDYDELLSALDLDRFENVELSTLKLFRDHSSLMKQYDIHDEYELHNLLKKICPSENTNIKFKKMPTIEFGSADIENQVLNMLIQYAPITADNLANAYENEYGVKAATVRGNYFGFLDDYYYQGVYTIDFAAMPTIQFDRMKTVLDNDFYTVQEIKRLYKREFPHAEEKLINPYTLKTLNFRVYCDYVVKNTYSSASDYFRWLLTTNDIVDARNFSKSLQSVGAYTSELYKLRADYEIVEFSPLQYINIRRLNTTGITVENFNDYCKAVSKKYEKGEYFTITSMRHDGFVHEMDDLGFDEWFYSSILLEDRERFSYQRIGGTRIFVCGKPYASFGDMLVWLLEKYQKIDFYDLKDLLENHYGIMLPRDKILTIINGTELYYDSIMEAVYIDYDTYFEEI